MRTLILLVIIFCFNGLKAQWIKRDLNAQRIEHAPFLTPQDISFYDSSNGFLASNNSLMRYQNNTWRPVDGFPDSIYSVQFIKSFGPQNTFLCTYNGEVYKYNGTSFTHQYTGSWNNAQTYGFHMISPTEGWLVGGNGMVMHFLNNTISYGGPVPSNFDFYRDIYFDSPTHGWLIGDRYSGGTDHGIIYEYNSGTWSFHSFLDEYLIDVEFSSPGKGFILGASAIYRYNASNGQWIPEPVPISKLQYRISLFNDNYGMTIGDSSALIYQNGQWTPTIATTPNLAGIACTGVGKAWAFSWDWAYPSPNENVFHQFKNNTWSKFSVSYLDTMVIEPYDEGVFNIAAVGKKDVWFEGNYVKIPAGSNWPQPAPVLPDEFRWIENVYSPSYLLATTGLIVEWKDSAWHIRTEPEARTNGSEYFDAIEPFPDTTGFIVGDIFRIINGTFIDSPYVAYYNGHAVINKFFTTPNQYLSAIDFSNKRYGWVVGDSGLIVKYSNGWSLPQRFTHQNLRSVCSIDSNTAWVAGDSGTLYKYNGTAWTKQILPTQKNLSCLSFTDANHGWVVGDSGVIFRYNGTAWTKDSSGTYANLFSIKMVDSTYGYIGTDSGFILQYIKPGTNLFNVYDSVCNGGTANFTVNNAASGSTFQWQQDTGAGFQNISNGGNFAGVNTSTLSISNVQSAMTGYRYRCIYTAASANQSERNYALRIKNVWTGASNNLWNNAANWSCGTVPDANTEVVITSGTIVIGSNITIGSLTVLPGVNITVSPGVVVTILH